MGRGSRHAIFVDWLTASQHHPLGGLPVVCAGVTVSYDAGGNARFERLSAQAVAGSFETSVRVQCDGFRVFLSGNVGRFSRQDNLFNFGWEGTQAAANRILLACGLPPFGPSRWVSREGEVGHALAAHAASGRSGSGLTFGQADLSGSVLLRGAVVSRLDLTCNFGVGSESQARAFIRWLSDRSVSRVKRGRAGDESVWWANTRHMFKAYLKWVEMVKHGSSPDEFSVVWAKREGVARVEIEAKKRLLSEIGLNDWGDITQEKLEALYREQTAIICQVDRSDEPDILDSVPSRSRIVAAAWLAGKDLASMMSRATLFRHAKVLREFGMDIMAPRNVEQFPVQVRVVELRPLEVPDWYDLDLPPVVRVA